MTIKNAQGFRSSDMKGNADSPVNHILNNFRVTVGADVSALNFFCIMELQAIRKGHRSFFTDEEQAHASQVLARLAVSEV